VRAPDSAINYWNAHGTPGHDVIDGLTLQDCDVRDISGTETGGNMLGATGHRVLLLGNHFDNSTRGEHVWRLSTLDRAVMSGNDLGNAPAPRTLIKMHAPHFNGNGIGRGRYTERIVISDNVFRGTGGHQWSVTLGPENDQSDERVRDVLVENNLFLPGERAQAALMLWGSDITVRINLFNRGAFGTCIGGGRRGIEPPSNRITIVHNTCYSSGERPMIAGFRAPSTNVAVFNNLCAGPKASSGPCRDGADESSGNLSVTNAGFAGSDMTGPPDFALTASSPGIDQATPRHSVTWDFDGRQRSIDGDRSGTAEPDIGALEFSP
jgi:hypothetical protein